MRLSVPLVKAVQELDSMNDTKDEQIKSLSTGLLAQESAVGYLQKEAENLRAEIEDLSKTGEMQKCSCLILSHILHFF